MTLTERDQTMRIVKNQVAKILLEHAMDGSNGNNHVTQRDMATALGTDWFMIHQALKSLNNDGVIKIECNRIKIYKELIQKVAEGA